MTRIYTHYIDAQAEKVCTGSVEVSLAPGIGIHLVGLSDAATKETLLRVVTALQFSGYRFPGQKVIINVTPAFKVKAGASFDLPIAMGLLVESEQIYFDTDGFSFTGQLALDGTLRHTYATDRADVEKLVRSSVCRDILVGPTRYDEECEPSRNSGEDGFYGFDSLREIVDYAGFVRRARS
jgi:hypothetical protein